MSEFMSEQVTSSSWRGNAQPDYGVGHIRSPVGLRSGMAVVRAGATGLRETVSIVHMGSKLRYNTELERMVLERDPDWMVVSHGLQYNGRPYLGVTSLVDHGVVPYVDSDGNEQWSTAYYLCEVAPPEQE